MLVYRKWYVAEQSAVCILYEQVSVAPIQVILGYSYLHNTHNLPQNTCV